MGEHPHTPSRERHSTPGPHRPITSYRNRPTFWFIYTVSTVITDFVKDLGSNPSLDKPPPLQAQTTQHDAAPESATTPTHREQHTHETQHWVPPNENDPDRDMAGDARTAQLARRMPAGTHAECNLAAARNILRDPYVTREFMALRQRGGNVEGDTRFPDWQRILATEASTGETVVTFSPAELPSTNLLLQARKFVFATCRPNHVTAHIRDGTVFRTYDNDSEARRKGTYHIEEHSRFASPGIATAVIPYASMLHVEAQAQQMARLVRRNAPIPEEQIMDLSSPPR